jgi:hypothetical protein
MNILEHSPLSEVCLIYTMFRELALPRIQETGCNTDRFFINFILILVVLYLYYHIFITHFYITGIVENLSV